jgi:hypothetical protein
MLRLRWGEAVTVGASALLNFVGTDSAQQPLQARISRDNHSMEFGPIVSNSGPALHTPSDEPSILQMRIRLKRPEVQRRLQSADSTDWRHVIVVVLPASLYVFDLPFDRENIAHVAVRARSVVEHQIAVIRPWRD